MRKGILTLILAVGLLGLAGQTWAATSDTISVTVSLGEVVSVSVAPGTWAIGPLALSGTSGPSGFTATNDGNVAEDFTIAAANGAGGWTLGANAGADTFKVTNAVPALTLTTSGQSLATNVAVSGTAAISLTYSAPTSDTVGAGVDQSFNVTVAATKYVP